MKLKISNSVVTCILSGVLVCVVTLIVLVSVFAWLVSGAYIPESSIRYVCVVTLVVSTIAGTVTAVAKSGEKPLWMALITSIVYFLLLLSITALFFEGMYEGVGVTALCIAGSAICVSVLKAKKGRIKRRSLKKRK